MSRSQKPSRQVAVDEQIQVVLAVFKGELSLAEAARRAIIGDGNALAVELGLFRRTYHTLRPHQALDDRTPRQA